MGMKKMDKKIKRIRKAIKERKQQRHPRQSNSKHSPMYELISDEERHGLYDSFTPQFDKSQKNRVNVSVHSSFFYQLLGSIILFISSFFIVKGNGPLFEKTDEWLQTALHEQFPFATVHDWYVRNLGTPLALLPASETVSSVTDGMYPMPLMGEVVETFQTNGLGIEILPEQETSVQAVNKGMVIFAGSHPETDKTIIIQHPDRSETTYGKLSAIDVHLYELIDTNDVIGRIDPSVTKEAMFFSVEEKTGYVDPAKVINVNGSP